MRYSRDLPACYIFVLIYVITNVYAEPNCVPVTMFIRAEYFEQAVQSAFRHTKIIETSSNFTNNFHKLATSAEISATFSAFSGSAKAAYEDVTESVLQSNESKHNETSEKATFNPAFLQILRKITTEVSIDGRTAKTTTREFVDSVKTKKALSQEELKKKGEDYITYNYGHLVNGTVTRNTYLAEACIQLKSKKSLILN